MWELFTLGKHPYSELDNKSDVMEFLECGERLEKPNYCNDEIYEIMIGCWASDRDQRPTFLDLMSRVNEIISCDMHDDDNDDVTAVLLSAEPRTSI